MSRSYKNPIIKDAGSYGIWYRKIKRSSRQYLKEAIKRLDDPYFNFVIPQEKELVNDWDVCDWTYNFATPFKYSHYDKINGLSEKEAKLLYQKNIKKYSRK